MISGRLVSQTKPQMLLEASSQTEAEMASVFANIEKAVRDDDANLL
jgi:hypothetical protein